MLKSKRGAEVGGTQVMVILLVIALFMVLYLLFIPPEEREKLLEPNKTAEVSGLVEENKLELLAESPGLLTPTTEAATIHRIPSVNLLFKIEPEIDMLAQNIIVSNGLFSKSTPTLRFRTENLENAVKVNLFFSVQKGNGELRVKVNDNTVYTEENVASGVKIIEVPKSVLQKDNEIILSTSSPGILFWKVNNYDLKDVGVKQEFESVNIEEERLFSVTQEEKTNLDSARLKYFQICNSPAPKELVSLDISLNDQRIHTAEIRCITTQEEIELDLELLQSGSNKLTFRLEEGDFSFNQLTLETETTELDRPTYFFSLSQKQFDDVILNKRKLTMNILMEKARLNKIAKFLINNNELIIQTEQSTFDVDLRDYAVEGTNFVKIIPENSFNMVGLKVTLEK